MKILNEFFESQERSLDTFDFYFKDLRWATFDIETTGLSPEKSSLILSGLAIPTDDGRQIAAHQIFSQGNDEKEVIETTAELLKDIDVLITYNGASFDIPFFEKRAKHHGIDIKLPYNLDIYKLLKNHSDVGKFTPNLKQKTIESYLGLWVHRKDEIDGAESVKMYAEYLQTSSPDLERAILLHNSDDIKQLYRIMSILNSVDMDKAMSETGFVINDAIITSVTLHGQKVFIKGNQNVGNHMKFDDEKGLHSSFENNSFHIKLSLIEYMDLLFVDLNKLSLDKSKFYSSNALHGDYLALSFRGNPNYNALNILAMELVSEGLKSCTK